MASRADLASLHLLVVGDGELRGELRTARRSAWPASRACTLRARAATSATSSAAIDMFVMPSLWEGLPLSLVLAMGAGLPAIASRVAGIPEVVEDDVSGLLVPPGDTAQLGAALARVTRAMRVAGAPGRRPRARSCARASASTATSRR